MWIHSGYNQCNLLNRHGPSEKHFPSPDEHHFQDSHCVADLVMKILENLKLRPHSRRDHHRRQKNA